MVNKTENTGFTRESYLEKIQPFLNKNVIKVIVGMRRSGKSFLMRQMIAFLKKKHDIDESRIVYIDKESMRFDFIQTHTDLYQYVKERKPAYVFVDEVQNIQSWEKAVASFNNEGIDTYITGSNANILSSDLATHLAGRYIQIPVYTLSFKEFIRFNQKEGVSRKKAFAEYLNLGGFPVLSQFQGDRQSIDALIRDIFESIILKDIVSRHKIRRVNLLHNIVRFIADNIGNLFSANKVAAFLKSERINMDVETVYDYLGHLVATFAVHKVRRYDIKGKRHLESIDKYYLGDIGLRHALLGYRENDINQFLENIVYLELLRRGYTISVGKLDDREIDFIAEKQNEKCYIQVCYLLADKAVFDREFTPLEQVRDSYPKLVLSMDDESYGNSFQGIRRLNLIDWLLE